MAARIPMGMAGPDAVLFVVGMVLFAGAFYAIVQEQGSEGFGGGATSPFGAYNVAFKTKTELVEEKNAADLRSAELAFDVQKHNVSRVIVSLTCTDPAAQLGTFSLTVEIAPPNATPVSATGTCGAKLEIPVNVTTVPNGSLVEGSTREEAQANVPTAPGHDAAMGTWTVTISGQRGNPTDQLPGASPAAPSGKVSLSAEAWAAELSPVTK